MQNKVLIISFTFPPTAGIGGRRWAKFAKYLHRCGIDINIIASKQTGKEISSWVDDIKEYKEKITYIKSGCFKHLNIHPGTFYEKIMYRTELLFVKIFTKGTYFDKGICSKKAIFSLLKQKKENGFKKIIVTGAPFSLLYFAAIFKSKNTDIKLIVDIRDPWTDGKQYGMNSIAKKRFKEELRREAFVFEQADIVFVPVKKMQDSFIHKYQKHSKKINLLPHGYDSDDFPETKTGKIYLNKSKIKLIYGGSIYNDLDVHLKSLQNALSKEKNIDLTFYTNDNIPKYLVPYINIYKPIPSIDFQSKVNQSDFVLIMFPDRVKDFISTKFYEIIYLKKPIIFVAKEGFVSDFLTKNKLGIHITPEKLAKGFGNLQDVYSDYNYSFDISKYSYEKLTNKLITNL